MTSSAHPISLLDRFNASVLLAVTPEYAQVRAARLRTGDHLCARPGPFAIQPEFRTIRGKKLRFAQAGRKDAPVVMLLSPLPQSIIAFDQIWPTLAEHFRLIALDLPGFGRSEGGYEVMSFEAQSGILDEFIRSLDLHDLHIVGPDVGMAVALHYAIHREHRLKSLIIGDGPGVLPTANGSIIDKAVNSPFWRMVFRIAGAGAFVEGANRLAYVHYRPSNQEVADYVASYAGRIGPVTEWFRKYPENLATIDQHLDKIDLPVKLFWGDLDQFLLLETAHRIKARLRRSKLTVFETCGHFSYQDRQAEFAQMIIDWVNVGCTSLP
jgi:pimeloyl-ACP methyl ester carboxylesterase